MDVRLGRVDSLPYHYRWMWDICSYHKVEIESNLHYSMGRKWLWGPTTCVYVIYTMYTFMPTVHQSVELCFYVMMYWYRIVSLASLCKCILSIHRIIILTHLCTFDWKMPLYRHMVGFYLQVYYTSDEGCFPLSFVDIDHNCRNSKNNYTHCYRFTNQS